MKTITALLLVLSALPVVSKAQGSLLYSGLGFGRTDFESPGQYDTSLAPGQSLQDKSGFTEIYFGYRYNNLVAVEVGYADAGEMSKTYRLNPAVPTLAAVNNREQVDLQKISLNAVMEYPLAGNFSVFGSLGYARVNLDRKISGGLNPNSGGLHVSANDLEEGASYGVGIKYLFADRFAVRLQQVEYSLGNVDLSTTRLALEWEFFRL